MQRTIPYYVDKIVPDSIAQGKNVLIASSENAIRGLLMHLCEVSMMQSIVTYHLRFSLTFSLRLYIYLSISFPLLLLLLPSICPIVTVPHNSSLPPPPSLSCTCTYTHVMQIPTDRIHEVEIPTGLPLVFNVRKKCIQVLDDGLDTDSLDPLARYVRAINLMRGGAFSLS